MKATGVCMVVFGGLMLGLRVVVVAATGGEFFDLAVTAWLIVLVGGLIVWSLQQIREAILGGHPRDAKAKTASSKPRWPRTQ